ncbi:MAG: DUF5683 domain-containing protein [Prevotellaceae bacterium]|nr:DUF5683 domain-containing protein [Prevotellaceae bacterium]
MIFSWFVALCGFAQSNDSVFTDITDTVVIVQQQTNIEKKSALKAKIEAGKTPSAKFDTLDKKKDKPREIFIPNPNKSMWYGLLFPGAGQIYNRRYWKLPIVYGGFAAFAYGISYNGKLYKLYSNAYRDKADTNENTDSFKKLEREGRTVSEETLQTNMNNFRRSRDLCIIGAVAFYAITVVDAFVDAVLADFDISPNLSMKIHPTVIPSPDEMSLAMSFKVNF